MSYGGGIAAAGPGIWGDGDDRLHAIGFGFDGLQGVGRANRNAERQNSLVRLWLVVEENE